MQLAHCCVLWDFWYFHFYPRGVPPVDFSTLFSHSARVCRPIQCSPRHCAVHFDCMKCNSRWGMQRSKKEESGWKCGKHNNNIDSFKTFSNPVNEGCLATGCRWLEYKLVGNLLKTWSKLPSLKGFSTSFRTCRPLASTTHCIYHKNSTHFCGEK